MTNVNETYARVLIAEDDSAVAPLVEKLLRGALPARYQLQTSVLQNGAEALEALALAVSGGKPFDVAICGGELQGNMGCVALIRKGREASPGTKYFIFTGSLPEDYLKDAQELGVPVFAKPGGLAILVKTVKANLEQKLG